MRIRKPVIAVLGNLVGLGLSYARSLSQAGAETHLYYSAFGSPSGEAGDPRIEGLDADEGRRIHEWNALPRAWGSSRSGPVVLLRRSMTAVNRERLLVALRRATAVETIGAEIVTGIRSGRPCVAHAAGSDLRELVLNHVRGLERSTRASAVLAAFREAAAVLVCIPELLSAARESGLATARYQPMPIDLARFGRAEAQADDHPLRIFGPARLEWTYTGRLRRGSTLKGNDRLVRAFAQVADKLPGASLILRSIGADFAATKQLIEDLRLGNRVTFVGGISRDALVAEYRRADVVVDQFVGGCLGLAGLEAMACARPLITHVEPAQYAAVGSEAPPVAAAREPEEIAGQLLALRDPALRASLGEAERAFVERHHDARIVGRDVLRLTLAIGSGGRNVS